MLLGKTLESPLDSKEIKPVNPEYSLEGLMLKLKLRYFDHLMRSTDSLEKTLMLGNTIISWYPKGNVFRTLWASQVAQW